ncbi:MAG: hypothetical protein ABIO96_07150 [Nitrospiraceae bacterium]
MASDWTPEDEQNFAVSTNVIAELKASLPAKVDAAKTSQKAKLPFFTTCLRECLLYRITELGESACKTIRAGELVSGAVLVRALLEAVALIVLLDQRVRETIESGDIQKLEDLVSRASVGCRNKVTPLEAINVRTILEHATKKYEGLGDVYDELSEIAHPNWGGLLGAYGTLNTEERLYELGMSKTPLPILLITLNGALQVFQYTYNGMVPSLHKLVEVCDKTLG